jgi:hypothetical protein
MPERDGGPARAALPSEELLQNRQREAGGLAGAGLGAAHDVETLKDGGNGLHLNRRGRV